MQTPLLFVNIWQSCSRLVIACCLIVLTSMAQATQLVDIEGRSVSLPTPAAKITVDDGRDLIALALLHDKPGKWLAAWPHDTQRIGKSFYAALEKWSPALKNVPQIASSAGNFNLESLLALNPDAAVFSLGHGPSKQQLQVLQKVGIPSLFIDFFIHPMDNQDASLKLLGQLTGAEARANAFIAFRQQHLTRIATAVATLSPADYPTVFFEAHAGISKDCCFSPGNGNLGDYITFVGGHNIGADVIKGASGKLSLEYVVSRQPDIYIATGGPALSGKGLTLGPGVGLAQARATFKNILSRTGIKALKAVNSGHAFGLSHLLLNSPLDIVAIEAMAKWIHPQLFKDLDPAKTLRAIETRFLPVPYQGTHWLSQPTNHH